MINASNATPQSNEDDLMAGLPMEGQMTGGPVMPPNMPHFDYDPQAEAGMQSVQPATPESVESYLLKVVQEQRRQIAELTQAREGRKTDRPAAPMTSNQQRDALALADQNTVRKNSAPPANQISQKAA